MKSYVLRLLITSCFLSINAALAVEDLKIPMDLSTWSYKGNKFECNLKHSDVPQGKFYFRSEAGGRNLFFVDVNDSKWNRVLLEGKSPPWEKKVAIKEKASYSSTRKNDRIIFSEGVNSLIEDIKSGSWIQLSFSGNESYVTKRITLPTIQIQQALTFYQQCRENLPKFSFTQARDQSIYFQLGQTTLEPSQESIIADLYRYVEVDDRVAAILIDGHTDNVGSKFTNLNISRQRAEEVAETLIHFGIDRNVIQIRAHGDRYPIASNATPVGQAKNRRVRLRLVRDNERITNIEKSEVKQPSPLKQEKVQVQ